MFFNVLFMFVFNFVCSVIFVLFCVLFLLLCMASPFPIFVQIYRLLPPGGNPMAVKKYIISYHIIYNIPNYIRYFRRLVHSHISVSNTAVSLFYRSHL